MKSIKDGNPKQARKRTPLRSLFPSRQATVCGALMFLISWSVPFWAQSTVPTTARRVSVARTYGQLPLYFEKNVGQTASQVKFLSHGTGYGLFLTSTEAVLDLYSHSTGSTSSKSWMPESETQGSKAGPVANLKRSVVRMHFLGANESTQVAGVDELEGKSNYFIGNDPRKWLTAVPTFAKVQYSDVYPGVDVVYYGHQGYLEYDLRLKPKANVGLIRIGLDGARQLRLTKYGDLLMDTDAGTLVLKRPAMYQRNGPERKQIRGHYALRGAHEVGFQIETYDKNEPLVVDPVLEYSTYLGGTGTDTAGFQAIAVDMQGNTYVTGGTTSRDFPATTTLGTTTSDASPVVFVSKLNAAGTALVYSTYLSGGNSTTYDYAEAVAVDTNGYAYLAGMTSSASFPVTSTAYQVAPVHGAPRSVFVSKLSADGQSLLYSTYLGGGGDQWPGAITVDGNQVAYVGGVAQPSTTPFPVTSNAFQTTATGSNPTFVSKIDTTMSGNGSLVYSTLLGGSSGVGERIWGIARDSSGRVYVDGWTFSTDFPVTSTAYQGTSKAQTRMATSFLAEIDPSKVGAAGLVYSTYFGGSAPSDSYQEGDVASSLQLDPLGKVYVSGFTESADFPVTVGTGPVGGIYQGFIAKFDLTKSNAASLVYSRIFGGRCCNESYVRAGTQAGQLGVDSLGDVYVVGTTTDPSFPLTTDAVQSTLPSDGESGFLTIFSSDASTILYSTYFGSSGPNGSQAYGTFMSGLALDASNNIYVAGETSGMDLPTSKQLFQPTFQGTTSNLFMAKFGGISTPTITSLSTTSGLIGASLTIGGLNFGSTGTVTFNGVVATPTSWSATSISVPVPVGAKSGNVVVTAAGVPSNPMSFTVLGTTPVVLVQNTQKRTGTLTLATLAFDANNSAGNWIGVCVRATGLNQALSVSDSRGNIYRQALSANETGGGNTLAIFYAENIAPGANIVAVSDSARTDMEITIFEYSGVALSGSLDTAVSATGNNSSPSSGNASTVTNGELLLGAIASGAAATFTAGTGYKAEQLIPAEPDTNFIAEDQILSFPGTAAATATLSASNSWAAGLAVFKPSSSGPGTAPTITGLTPNTGSNGTVVTISGYNFGVSQGTSTVKFNGTTASPSAWSDGSITVADPSGATDGTVVVTVNGVPSNGVWFPEPHITHTSPTTGAVGASVTINGSSFGTATGTVRFNGITASPTSWGASSIVVVVPAGATTGPVVVTNSSGIVSNDASFTVSGTVPTVTSLSPSSGAVGTSVIIRGTGFGSSQGSSTVNFNGVPAGTASQWTASSITIAVPTGAMTGNVVVTAGGQSSVDTRVFTVSGTPGISAVSPKMGGIGAAVTITGSNLGTSGTVTFNGIAATPWSWSPSLVVVPVPSGATNGAIMVTVGSTQLSAGIFSVRSSVPATATEFSYDAMGRVIQKTVCTPMNCGTGQAPLNLSVTYDLAGDTTSISFYGPTIQYAIDTAGRVTQVTSSWNDSQHPATLATVDPANGYWPTAALRKATMGDGLTESTVYNNRAQPCRINVNSSGALLSNCSDAIPTGNLQDFADKFNAGTSDNGNIAGFTATGQQNFNRSYTYDSLNRIQTMSAPGDQCSGLSWTIDPWGNRTAQNNTGGSCLSPAVTVDTNNRFLGAPYQYDASGDLTNDGFHTYTYDAEGRITKVDGGSTASYVYDAFGARVEKTANGADSQYVYDQDGQLNTVFANGAFQRTFVYMGGQALAEYFENTTYFVHGDKLRSTRLLTRLDQTIRESDDYYPFGELVTTPATGDIQKFTGKEHDTESGLDMFGARYYGSSLGRFMTPDWATEPMAVPYANFGNPQSLNLYVYVENNPTTFGDPDGHCVDDSTICGFPDPGYIESDFSKRKQKHDDSVFTIRIKVYDWTIYIPIHHPYFAAALGHHGFPRALFRFLPKGPARNFLEREFVTGPLEAKHYYDAAHRAYNQAIKDLLKLDTEEGQEEVARDVIKAGQKILDSDNPAIAGFLDNMKTPNGMTGRQALEGALQGDGEALGELISGAIGEVAGEVAPEIE